MNQASQQPLSTLLRWLLNKEVDLGLRDDAAMDLGEFDESEALAALLKIGQDRSEDPILFDVVGESLGEIWTRNGNFQPEEYAKLVEIAQDEAFFVIKRVRPDWIEKYRLQRE